MGKAFNLLATATVATLVATGSTALAFDINVGDIDQSANNSKIIGNIGIISTQSLTGHGASEFVSASGAEAVAGVSSINAASPSVKTGDITNGATNNGAVLNGGLITTWTGNGFNFGDIEGRGASVSVGASGSRTATGYTSINGTNYAASIQTRNITQNSVNTALVGNLGIIAVGNVSGNGASVSIGASGATSAVGVTSINDAKAPAVVTGNITQTATNHGHIGNVGIIVAGNISGTGASAGISASGAAAVASVSIMK